MRLPVTSFPISGCNHHIYLTCYRDWLTKQPITPNTLRAYHSCLKQFLHFLEYAGLGNQQLDNVNGMNEAVRIYLDFLRQSKKAPTSINANINALRNFSQFLGLDGIELKRERCYYKPASVLTWEEQQRFLQAVDQQEARDKALALVLFYTGLRIGDCARLNFGDIGAGAACLCLENATVPLNKQTVIAMKQWLEERKKIADAQVADSGLWLTKQAERLSISGIAFVINRIGWQTKLTLSAEMLRRTALTKATDQMNRKDLASKFGGYVSAATIDRYGVSLPTGSTLSVFDH
jgi:site-specific recombinase XerD